MPFVLNIQTTNRDYETRHLFEVFKGSFEAQFLRWALS